MAVLPSGIEALFAGLRPRSIASLEMAIRTHQIGGVPASLHIQIPATAGRPVEVFLSTAPTSLVSDMWKFGLD